MQKLIDGVHRFRSDEFGRYSELFARLSNEGQKPHTLFITCSDSRILAELITQSQPGDLFVLKNVGNIIPAPSDIGDLNSVGAAIEFAVGELQVEDIVVCGHSQCGAMTALVDTDFFDPHANVDTGESTPSDSQNSARISRPYLHSWLRMAAPVRDVIDRNYAHLKGEARVTATSQENVLFALENLRTYPLVAKHLADGSLHLHGWFFKIATAELFAYDPDHKQFLPLIPPETGAAQ